MVLLCINPGHGELRKKFHRVKKESRKKAAKYRRTRIERTYSTLSKSMSERELRNLSNNSLDFMLPQRMEEKQAPTEKTCEEN
jgi:hypothetical protein